MDYLALVKALAGLSGTVDVRTVSSVGTGGRIGILAALIRDAWLEIQGEQQGWRFMVEALPDGSRLTTGVGRYTDASLGISNPPWNAWLANGAAGTIPLSAWPLVPADGEDPETLRGHERPLTYRDFPSFRALRLSGAEAARPQRGQPIEVSVDESDGLVVWPVPDRTYGLAGTYRRAAQELVLDDDVPIIASEYRNVIVWAAKLLLDRRDEAPPAVQSATLTGLSDRAEALRRRYLPAPSWGRQPLGFVRF